jgi:hypothetical protein
MERNISLRIGQIALALLFIFFNICTAEDTEKKDTFTKPSIDGDYTWMDINNISTFVGNNGSFNRHPNGIAGFEWPKGSGNTANYASGIWIGAIDSATNTVRVAVAEYSYEYTAGPIGVGINPVDDRWQMYKISRGDDALNNPDYANWPGEDGAPYIDKNGNGVWDAGIDEPELLGDQTVWCVFNDNDTAVHTNMKTLPLGIEVQLTAFAFDRSNALGNTIFYKWKLINKGGRTLIDAYVTIWTDIDIGDSGDDFNGCDTTLGLGYTYNYDAIDGVYGAAVPATGFDFFQGPIVPSPGDTANVSGLRVPDYKNLKMTSFVKYNNDTSPLGNPQTGQEVYNYMRAYDRNGLKITDPYGNPADFMLPGDPTKPYSATTNWIEQGAGGDRRFLMSSGPISMAPGDTQELVAGNLIAVGADYLGSVTALKQADLVAQTAYDLNFKLPTTPSLQEVSATGLDQKIVLHWAENYTLADQIEATHTYDPLANASGDLTPYYDFEGYVVYQYSNIQGSNEKRVATFDIINNVRMIYDYIFDINYGAYIYAPVKYGTDNGIERSILITNDKYTNLPPQNNTDYYFAVTSYSYNAESVPKTLESSKKIFAVKPQAISWHLPVTYGDTLKEVYHSSGKSDGSIIPLVIDPLKLTGHNYKVEFTESIGGIAWNLIDSTLGKVLVSGYRNQTGDGRYPITDGIMVKVVGPPLALNHSFGDRGVAVLPEDENLQWLGPNGNFWGMEYYNGGLDLGSRIIYYLGYTANNLPFSAYRKVEISFDAADSGWAHQYRRYAVDLVTRYRFDSMRKIPIRAKDITDPENPKYLNIAWRDQTADGIWDPVPENVAGTDARRLEVLLICPTENSGSTPTYGDGGPWENDAMYITGLMLKTGYTAFSQRQTITVLPYFLNTVADVWTFNSIVLSVDDENIVSDYRLDQNYPNPFNPATSIKYQLPVSSHVVIKIYNLLGQDIKTLADEIQTAGYKSVEWNSTNNNGNKLASGVYFFRIDATSVSKPSRTFSQVKKMLLLR